MKRVIDLGNKLEVKFNFENKVLIEVTKKKIKSLIGNRYNRKTKSYILPKIDFIFKKLKEWRFPLRYVNTEKKSRRIVIPDNIPLRRYQKIGVRFLYNKGRALLGDDCGIGKTIQAITNMYILDQYPTLIICPGSVKLKWQREIDRWVNLDSYIVQGRTDNNWKGKKIVIINYEVLMYYQDVMKGFKLLIADECHRLNNIENKTTQAFLKIQQGVRKINGLSATPIINRPSEFFTILSILRPDIFNDWWFYIRRYCDMKMDNYGNVIYKGHNNTRELFEIINNEVMLRRLKSQVLPELPPRTDIVYPIEIDNMGEYEYADSDFRKWLFEKKGKFVRNEARTKINELKQLVTEGKMKAVFDWVDSFLESGNKLVVLCWHVKIVDMLMEKYKDIAVRYTGKDSNDDKNKSEYLFQNDNRVKLFIGNIKAAGEGIELYASSNLVFLELAWSPVRHKQGGDRIHRIGQKDACACYYFIAKGTIEETIIEILFEKQKVLDAVLDGKDVNEESVLEQLCSRLLKTKV